MGIQERVRRALGGTNARPVNFDPPTVRDALGRVLELGDEVLVVQPTQTMRVAGVQHVTAPGAPPGLVELTLVSRVLVAGPNNSTVEGIYRLRHAKEIQDGFLQNIGAAPAGEATPPPAGDPPPTDKPTTIHLTDRGA